MPIIHENLRNKFRENCLIGNYITAERLWEFPSEYHNLRDNELKIKVRKPIAEAPHSGYLNSKMLNKS